MDSHSIKEGRLSGRKLLGVAAGLRFSGQSAVNSASHTRRKACADVTHPIFEYADCLARPCFAKPRENYGQYREGCEDDKIAPGPAPTSSTFSWRICREARQLSSSMPSIPRLACRFQSFSTRSSTDTDALVLAWDLETTGLIVHRDQIVQLAVVSREEYFSARWCARHVQSLPLPESATASTRLKWPQLQALPKPGVSSSNLFARRYHEPELDVSCLWDTTRGGMAR
jgi:hypothetical protein